MKPCYLLFTTMVVSASAYADIHDAPFDDEGFSGEISLLAGYGKSNSNLTTDNDDAIDSLNSSDNSSSDGFLAPLGELRYTFNNQQLFIGTSRSDLIEGTVALALGYAFQLGEQSSISLSYLPTIVSGEVWKDPYLENTRRQKTDVKGNGYRLQYNNINNSNINAEFAYYDKKVEKEQSGSTLSNSREELERGGTGYLVGLSTGFSLTPSIIVIPNVRYHTFSADGKAMAFDEYSLNLTAIYRHNQHAVSMNTRYAEQQYDGQNPMFNKTRKDSAIGVNVMYEYSDFLGYQDVGLNLLAGFDKRDSNITFYDEKGYMLGVGASYIF